MRMKMRCIPDIHGKNEAEGNQVREKKKLPQLRLHQYQKILSRTNRSVSMEKIDLASMTLFLPIFSREINHNPSREITEIGRTVSQLPCCLEQGDDTILLHIWLVLKITMQKSMTIPDGHVRCTFVLRWNILSTIIHF